MNDQSSVEVSLLAEVGALRFFAAEQSMASGGGPPYHGETWWVRDDSGREVPVAELVDEGSLLWALKHDPFLLEEGLLGEEALAARSLDELYAAEPELDLERAVLVPSRWDGEVLTVRLGFLPGSWWAGMAPSTERLVDWSSLGEALLSALHEDPMVPEDAVLLFAAPGFFDADTGEVAFRAWWSSSSGSSRSLLYAPPSGELARWLGV